MFALGVRYLHGFVAATKPDRRDQPEWPPHPGRVFMALVAAHFQTGDDPAERDALIWLESLAQPPAIHAGAALSRQAVTQYVPVNDKPGPAKAMLQSVPLARDRQPRTFARAWLEDDTVYLIWPTLDITESTRHALINLCAKVTRIGHSSSLVQMWVAGQTGLPEVNWLPDNGFADVHLRLAGPGMLQDLERRYNREAVEAFTELEVAIAESTGRARTATRRQLKERFPDGHPPSRLRPRLAVYQGYRKRSDAPDDGQHPKPASTVFDSSFTVLALHREEAHYRHLELSCVLQLIQCWREELLRDTDTGTLPQTARQMISGLDADGKPLQQPHLAFLPLAFVDHPHADGRLLGMGITLPAEVSDADRSAVLRRIAQVQQLNLDQLGRWDLQSTGAVEPPWNLHPRAWTADPQGATQWATVTPIAFDRHPRTREGSAYLVEMAAMIAGACVHLGLPEPSEVTTAPISAHQGAPPSRDFPRLRRKDGSERRHTHAFLSFDTPVQGPLILGAGRYRGYGFCRPITETTQQSEQT